MINIKKKKSRFFESYISKVLKNISENSGITSNCKQQLNTVICEIANIICNKCFMLTEISKKKTISVKEITNTIKIILPQGLKENAIKYSNKTIEKFNSKEENIKGSSRQKKAGIIFPPSVSEKFLRRFGLSKFMVTNDAPIYLASVLEYLCLEILENAFSYTLNNKKKRITIRDVELSIRNDSEIDEFFLKNNIMFLGGGSLPYIHPKLLEKKQIKRNKKIKNNNVAEKKKHRFRPGTVSVREIKKMQKINNCVTCSRYPFEQFVRNIIYSKKDKKDIKISKSVFIILQYFIEQELVNILKSANFASIHAGRVKLTSLDIKFVNSIRNKGIKNPYDFNNNNQNKQKYKNKLQILNLIEEDLIEEDLIEEDLIEEDLIEEDLIEEDLIEELE